MSEKDTDIEGLLDGMMHMIGYIPNITEMLAYAIREESITEHVGYAIAALCDEQWSTIPTWTVQLAKEMSV